MLVVQFLLGMITNLYVAIPGRHPGSGPGPYLSGAFQSVIWSLTSGIPALVLHAAEGILLVLAAIEMLVRAALIRRPAPIWLTGAALAASSWPVSTESAS
jgi:hypothetical protein